jgi:WhiB family transcriptional regulator, redox-sensing transcriptional regulator
MTPPKPLSREAIREAESDPRLLAAWAARSRQPRHWQEQGSCVGKDPELFFPDAHNRRTETQSGFVRQQYCRDCPVATACLVDAMLSGRTDGVQGDASGRERRTFLLLWRRWTALEKKVKAKPPEGVVQSS